MSNKKNYPIITIDGPSGAGKGTVCWQLAEALGYQLLDSGALYRIVGLKAYQAGLLDLNNVVDEEKIESLTLSLKINFVANPKTTQIDIIVNDEQVSNEIRNEIVGGYASRIAVFPKVRQALLQLQRDMSKYSGVIADGRDMGTVIFPNAEAKIYLIASAEARANRRVYQLKKSGEVADYKIILEEIKARDERDENRKSSPSKPASDALVVDSSVMSIDEVVHVVKTHCISKGIQFINN